MFVKHLEQCLMHDRSMQIFAKLKKKICETNDDMRPTCPKTSYTDSLSILNSTIID